MVELQLQKPGKSNSKLRRFLKLHKWNSNEDELEDHPDLLNREDESFAKQQLGNPKEAESSLLSLSLNKTRDVISVVSGKSSSQTSPGAQILGSIQRASTVHLVARFRGCKQRWCRGNDLCNCNTRIWCYPASRGRESWVSKEEPYNSTVRLSCDSYGD